MRLRLYPFLLKYVAAVDADTISVLVKDVVEVSNLSGGSAADLKDLSKALWCGKLALDT